MDEGIEASPALCSHCGQWAMLWIRAGYTYTVDENVDGYMEPIQYVKWSILQCPQCFRPTLIQADQVSQREYPGTKLWTTTTKAIRTLYPPEKSIPSSIPETIGKIYAEAIQVKLLSPRSCAVLVRRTLEAVCQHENATGRTLANKLKNLADTGKIPQTLVDVALHLRQLGNLAAHHDVNDDVTIEDVPIILDFIYLFLEYLYVAPAKVQAVKDRLNNPRKNSSLEIDISDDNPF